MFDYTLLRSFIACRGYTPASLAKAIGINETSIKNKLENKTPFTLPEMQAIARELELDPEGVNACFFAE